MLRFLVAVWRLVSSIFGAQGRRGGRRPGDPEEGSAGEPVGAPLKLGPPALLTKAARPIPIGEED